MSGPKPDKPGRGAWTQVGGLLPLKPGGKGAGYYRPPYPGETMIGTARTTYTDLVIVEAVKVLQRMLDVTPDGLFGDVTGAALVARQGVLGVKRDGVAGPDTLRALLLMDIVGVAAEHDVPVYVLGGVCVYESSLDLGAVGTDGTDVGLAQINLASATHLHIADAVDPITALNFTATSMRTTYERWVGKTKADPWKIATAQHNSPKLAQAWALDPYGNPPYSKARAEAGQPQIGEYAAKALAAWEAK